MRKTVTAYTGQTPLTPFINISVSETSVFVTVRDNKGVVAEIEMPHKEYRKFISEAVQSSEP